MAVDFIGIAGELKKALNIHTRAKGKRGLTLKAETAPESLLEKAIRLLGGRAKRQAVLFSRSAIVDSAVDGEKEG